ncbi:helix-turn-helix domain-containing protein [Cryobacterium sp. RTS3]|uniref:helix-turn-helix domain-containing protein n=1 Tax=Cryobacterium sp. RTS3 TaxID=3048643 RepID=UPI002B225A06|nr:helix-turn-helix domain-containing protein [Cryobacterium sp. RTS3]MEA9999133.1 helix-turn-helix domain-containing protein [Cryobacterium sp. RTS3]
MDLLTASDVAKALRLPEGDDVKVYGLCAKGRLLAFERGGEWVFPGFQFDAASGLIEPVIADLVRLAGDLGWANEELVIWLCSPSGYFGGDRPVNHLHESDDLLEKARNEWTVEW